jgi:hypothetical protein
MRTILLLLTVLSSAASLHAEDPIDPADYLKIMMESKLHYNLGSKPAQTPVEEMVCRRRDASTRVVMNGETRKLVAWPVSDGYIFFEIIGQRCPLAMLSIDPESEKQLEAYVRKYVIVEKK